MGNLTDFKQIYLSFSGCLIALLLISCSGGEKAGFNNDMAVFKFSEESLHTPADFFEKVASVRLIPLDSTQSGLMAGAPSSDLIVCGDGFIVYDLWDQSKICRFSPNGKFLNTIGERGRGPKEYINLRGVQVLGDTLLAHFSTKETIIHYYLKEGKYIKSEKFDLSSSDMRKIGNDFLLARGYGLKDPVNRVILKSPQGDKLFFETPANIPSIGEASPMFSIYNDRGGEAPAYYLLREGFNDTVYMYSTRDEQFKAHVAFDFGKVGVDKRFFEQDSYDKAFEILLAAGDKEGFVTGIRYMENEKIRWGEFILNQIPQGRFFCFYEDKNDQNATGGEWFSLSEDGMSVSGFAGAIKQLYNGRFYSILQSDFCLNLPAYVKSKISNPQVLEELGENSNCVVAVLDMN